MHAPWMGLRKRWDALEKASREGASWVSWKRDGRGASMALMSLKEGWMGKGLKPWVGCVLRRIAPFV